MISPAALWLSLLVGCTAALGDTVVLTPVADTSLFSQNPDNNYGGLPTLPLGGINTGANEGRVLLRFNLGGAIPANATVTGVSLRVEVSKESPGSHVETIDIHRVAVSWNEGGQKSGKHGDIAATGESSWVSRSKGTANWKTPGGQSGTDFVAAASGSLAIDDPGAYTVSAKPGMIADVAAWLANPTQNFGWILRGRPPVAAGSAKRIASREGGAAAPQLTVEFTVPAPAPPKFASALAVGNDFEIRFRAEPGLLYEVQYQDVLGPGVWTMLKAVAAGPNPVDAVVADPSVHDQRSYRLAITGTAP